MAPSKIVYFHLAEQKHNSKYPFAFLATYTLSIDQVAALHIPLGRVLQENHVDRNALLLELLRPIQKAAEASVFLKSLLTTDAIFKPTALTAMQAYAFLKDLPLYEAAGIIIKVPNWWNSKKPPRPAITLKLGNGSQALAGLDALLDFNLYVALPDGSQLSNQELNDILATQDNLVRIRGQWLELDQQKLRQVLDYWGKKSKRGLSFAESLRYAAGFHDAATTDEIANDVAEWSTILEGAQLQKILSFIRDPESQGGTAIKTILRQNLKAQLRPYQLHGVSWLWTLYNMQLGGCLADDMGLGKTMQILSLLLLAQNSNAENKYLLILPASLLGNWVAEIKQFAPTLRYYVLHSSENNIDASEINTGKIPNLTNLNLVITTYGLASRLDFLHHINWDIIIIDEAQAIKNPNAKQTRIIKTLPGRVKFVLTGTPIENNLLDLWSLFDLIAPGLLGSSKKFIKLVNSEQKPQAYSAIQRLIKPYILRRLKNDKRIINDLPDKTELIAYCTLTKQQAVLYQTTVDELKALLDSGVKDIQRSGLVLSYLMRLKQICNHPNQWLGHNQYSADTSGKFIRLHELCSVIAEKNEKVLIFTQFREIIPALSEFLATIFAKPGLELHGGTPIKKRAALVKAFQQPDGPPFFVLSLKAGGTGLNLTNAAHVIHFDRWWNPAVEQQATDRAYRIGQKNNVLVHKLVCRGTIEENIDKIIAAKSTLANTFIKSKREIALSELSNSELLNLISLDLNRALADKV